MPYTTWRALRAGVALTLFALGVATGLFGGLEAVETGDLLLGLAAGLAYIWLAILAFIWLDGTRG